MLFTNAPYHRSNLQPRVLPALPASLHAEPMTAPLNDLLQPLRRTSTALRITHAGLLDHKPGRRGLVHYEIATPDGAEAWTVFGKFYTESVQAARVHTIMRLLWAEIFAQESHLGVPQPLGCITQPPVLLYLPISGRFLDRHIAGAQILDSMRQAGKWLATLHRHRLPLDRQIQITTELDKLAGWARLVSGTYTDEAASAAQLYEHLQQHAGARSFEAQVPIHKDFHYGHLIMNGQLNVIDFDEMRLGDPNFDLAHFCAYLNLLSQRTRSAPPYASMASAFLNAYAEHTGWAPDDRFSYFYVYTCLKIARQLCAGAGPRPRPRGIERRRQVRRILKQGLAAMSYGREGAGAASITGPLERCA